MKGRKKLKVFPFPMLLFLGPVVLTACDKEGDAAAALAAIEAEYSEGTEAISEKYESLTRPEEGADSAELNAYEEKRADRALESDELLEAFLPRFDAMAEDHWGTAAGLEAKLWVMSRFGRVGEEEDDETRAARIAEQTDIIFETYAESPDIEQLAELSHLFTEEQADKYLGRLREDSPHAAVRAAAIYHPASRKLSRLGFLTRMGSEEPAEEGGETRAELDAEFQLLVDEYGDVPMKGSTYGAVAYAHLTAHSQEELAVGQPAPEIVGTDVDGNEMRLSDFLGKVTVIDFWGDW